MQTITTQTFISVDGKLRLELPTDLPPGPADVVLVVQSKPKLPAGSYPSLAGKLAGKTNSDINIEEELRGIRQRATQEATELPG